MVKLRSAMSSGAPRFCSLNKRAEFLAQGIGQFLAEHFETDRERVAGAHGARQEVERFRELLLERGQALGALLAAR